MHALENQVIDPASQPPPRLSVSKDYQQVLCDCMEDSLLGRKCMELIVINEGVARGCGIKYQNHPCPLCTLQYPIG